MIDTELTYRPGDVANGFILGSDMQWHPLPPPTQWNGSASAGGYGAPAWSAPAGQPHQSTQLTEDQADSVARSIASYERLSGILWIVLGVLQVFSVFLFIAGIWNILAGFSRLTGASAIEQRRSDVPGAYQGFTQLIVIGLVNFFFGAILGLVFVALDFWVRQQVLNNRAVFNR